MEAKDIRFSLLDIPDTTVCRGRAENGPSDVLWPVAEREGRGRALAGTRESVARKAAWVGWCWLEHRKVRLAAP